MITFQNVIIIHSKGLAINCTTQTVFIVLHKLSKRKYYIPLQEEILHKVKGSLRPLSHIRIQKAYELVRASLLPYLPPPLLLCYAWF